MNLISDLALDLGSVELDNEFESGINLQERASVQLQQKEARSLLFHGEAVHVSKRLARIDRRLRLAIDSTATRNSLPSTELK